MDIAALILSIYSALLATSLGYLAWNREKHRVRAFAQPFMVVEEGRTTVMGIAITVINTGVRSSRSRTSDSSRPRAASRREVRRIRG